MDTYFARHTEGFDVDDRTREAIWKSRRIAIQFPRDKNGDLPESDNSSLNPKDYSGYDRRVLEAFKELSTKGGYVRAQYHGKPGFLAGWIKPDSAIRIVKGRWGNREGLQGRVAKLKTLHLDKVRHITAVEALRLVACQPRQGTFMKWRIVGQAIERIVEGRARGASLESLLPGGPETMCSEFLRVRHTGLPQLAHLVMPVGRTMKDVDIYGLATDGNRILAPVTFYELGRAREKLEKLLNYKKKDCHLVLFCQTEQITIKDGVKVFPLSRAFDEFARTESGKRWLKYAT